MINSIGTRERRKINFLAESTLVLVLVLGVFIIRDTETTLIHETIQTAIIQLLFPRTGDYTPGPSSVSTPGLAFSCSTPRLAVSCSTPGLGTDPRNKHTL